MENINKYIKSKNNQLLNLSNQNFKSLFAIINNQEDRIFCEFIENYKINKIKYSEFKEYVYKMSNYLNNNIHTKKNSYIGILMENCVNFLAIFWALLMIGYKPLLINAKLPSFLNKDVLKMVDCQYIVTDDSFNSYDLGVPSLILKKQIGIDKEINSLEMFQNEAWENEIALTTTATTLNVKCCIYTGSDITNQMLNTKYILDKNKMMKKHYNGSLKQLCFLPFYHIFGLFATYFWFATFGRTFVFLTDLSSNTILKTIRKHEVTHLFAVPLLWNTMYKEIMKQVHSMDEKTQKKFYKGIRLSNNIQNVFPILGQRIAGHLFREVQDKTFGPQIKFMISGGGYISNDVLKTLNGIGFPLYNGYGSTEIGITSVELRKKPKQRNEASIGKPFPSVQYNIENETLYVKGNSICSKIISKENTISVNHEEWFNTFDLAYKNNQNNYFIIGRKDDVFIGTNGEKINPDTIEKELKFNLINHYCLLGIKNEQKNELALVLELDRNSNSLKLKKVLSEVNQNMEALQKNHFPIQNVYYTFDAICNQNAIKVSRKALNKLIEMNQVHLDLISNLNIDKLNNIELLSREICDEVKQTMSSILSIDINKINDDSHFIFDLGGTSLDYCTLLMELKKKYDVEFDLKEQSFSNAIEFSNYIIKKIK